MGHYSSAHPLFYLDSSLKSLVDVGCNVGAAIESAYQLGVSQLAGVEINLDAVKMARSRLEFIPECEIYHGSADELPLQSQAWAQVLCLEVLEHVPTENRRQAIQELHRILQPEGRLILTVPYRGIFSFLDPENMRFRFPVVYQWISRKLGGRSRDEGFAQQKQGVVWHHHFSWTELEVLLDPFFQVQILRWRGAWIAPLCDYLLFPLYRWKRTENIFFRIIEKVKQWDMRMQYGSLFAYNVLLVLKKRPME